jgi:hypothetical protein
VKAFIFSIKVKIVFRHASGLKARGWFPAVNKMNFFALGVGDHRRGVEYQRQDETDKCNEETEQVDQK